VKRFILVLVILMFSSQVKAQTAWGDLGNLLRATCGAVSGTGVPIPGVGTIALGPISDLDWLCTLSSMYRFVDGNILNGDWESFAKDVAGVWATDLANYMVNQTGVGTFSGWLNTANDAMRTSYRDFRKGMLNAMQLAILNRDPNKVVQDNLGLPITTAGGLADEYEKNSPMIRAVGDGIRIAETAEKFNNLDNAFRAKKVADESRDALDKALSPALGKAAQIIGTPITEGEADQLAKKAATASSTREAIVTQVEATASLMKQNAVFQSAVLNLLAEIAKQGVMTNTNMSAKKAEAQEAVDTTFDNLKAGLEDLAQENLDTARSTAASVNNVQDAAAMLYDSATLGSTDWGAMAP
jgi:hypothetical protein